MIWLFLALLCLLCACGIVTVLWLLHTYKIARRLVSRKPSGAVTHTSSTTDTTKVIKPRKGVGYPKDDK